jgi:hypothetical protein
VLQELTAGRLLAAVALVDQILLGPGLGLSTTEAGSLRAARALLAARRAARATSPRGH